MGKWEGGIILEYAPESENNVGIIGELTITIGRVSIL